MMIESPLGQCFIMYMLMYRIGSRTKHEDGLSRRVICVLLWTEMSINLTVEVHLWNVFICIVATMWFVCWLGLLEVWLLVNYIAWVTLEMNCDVYDWLLLWYGNGCVRMAVYRPGGLEVLLWFDGFPGGRRRRGCVPVSIWEVHFYVLIGIGFSCGIELRIIELCVVELTCLLYVSCVHNEMMKNVAYVLNCILWYIWA